MMAAGIETKKILANSDIAGGFAVVSPPETIRHFEVPFEIKKGPWIDYVGHPAYTPLLQSVSKVDRLRASLVFAKYFFVVLFKRLIFYEMIPAHLRKTKGLRKVFVFLKYGLGRRLKSGRARNDVGADESDISRSVYTALKADGICVIAPTRERFAGVGELVATEVEGLRLRRGESRGGERAFIESRASVLRTKSPQLFDAVELLFRECGVLDAVSAYTGRSVTIVDINPQINDHSDDFWRRIFPDLDVPQTDTAYYHRDASGGDVKAIIYLSNVKPENGPFTFVVGSHRDRPSGIVDWFGEANDHSGFSATDKIARRSFAALPAVFRRKCAFGNDIPADTEISRRIHAAEWKIAATRGHIVVFDTKGIHRGGMVEDGERIVMTCVLG